jgi:hypothetical protein
MTHMRQERWSIPVLVLGLLALATGSVDAQEPADSIRQALRIPLPPTTEVLVRSDVIEPGISIASPTGFGARGGDLFLGLAYQQRTRIFTRVDGGVAAGFGLGDPVRYLGLEVAVTSFGTVRSCCRGGIHFKAHRVIAERTSIALGRENAILWNHSENREATDAGQSFYGAVTRVFLPREGGVDPLSTLTVTVGAGDGRFRRERDIVEDRSTVNLFGSVAARMTQRNSLIADWTGHDLAAGMSLVVLENRPLFVTPAVADLTSRPRFIVGAGYGFTFSGIGF